MLYVGLPDDVGTLSYYVPVIVMSPEELQEVEDAL